MRIIAKFSKGKEVRFTSHLDVQRLFQRAFRRAQIPVAYSEGFNPHSIVSFATALSLGYTSDSEWFDVKLTKHMNPAEFMNRMNETLPNGFAVTEAYDAPEKLPSLTSLMYAARYIVMMRTDDADVFKTLSSSMEEYLGGSINVIKRTKGGDKEIDIRPMIYSMRVISVAENTALIEVIGQLNVSGGLNMELLLKSFEGKWGRNAVTDVHRCAIYSEHGVVLPKFKQQ